MSDGAQGGVVVKPSPCAAFKVVKANFLLHLLVISLDTPTQFDENR